MKTANTTMLQNYHATLIVHASAKEAMKKIAQVSKWWGTNFEGSAEKLHDNFTIRFGGTFVDVRIVETLPEKKVVWLVTDCNINGLSDKKEWNNTKVVFEVSGSANETKIEMTHMGLVPRIECFEMCEKGWDFYIKKSLAEFINYGKGKPDTPSAAR